MLADKAQREQNKIMTEERQAGRGLRSSGRPARSVSGGLTTKTCDQCPPITQAASGPRVPSAWVVNNRSR